MKRIILLAIFVIFCFAHISFAESGKVIAEDEFIGAFSTPTLPSSMGDVEKIGQFMHLNKTLAGPITDVYMREVLPTNIGSIVKTLTDRLILETCNAGFNAILNVKVEVSQSFSAHGSGQRVNGSDGIALIIVSISGTPAYVE